MDDKIKNAKIKRTNLGYEDHGILTAWLHLDYGGSGQGFGGYCMEDRPGSGMGFTGAYIAGVLKAVGVESWEDLPGKHVRVKADHGKVYAIGHIIEDRWFNPVELAEKCKQAAG